MRKNLLVKAVAGIALVAFVTAMAPLVDYLPVGSEAPGFESVATDGETYSVENLTTKGSAFFVFWKGRCPTNRRAAPFFNALKEAYGDKVNILGVVTASAEGTESWAEQFDVNYPMVPDEDGSLTKAYNLNYSIFTYQIGTDGKVAAVFEGFGFDVMSDLNKAIAAAAGVDAAEVDLNGTPARQTMG